MIFILWSYVCLISGNFRRNLSLCYLILLRRFFTAKIMRPPSSLLHISVHNKASKAQQNVNQPKGTMSIGIKYTALYNISNNTKNRAGCFLWYRKSCFLGCQVTMFLMVDYYFFTFNWNAAFLFDIHIWIILKEGSVTIYPTELLKRHRNLL